MSLIYELKSLSINEKVLPTNHETIVKHLFNIGQSYEKLNQFKIAFDYYKQVLLIYEQTLRFGHEDRQNIEFKIEELSDKL